MVIESFVEAASAQESVNVRAYAASGRAQSMTYIDYALKYYHSRNMHYRMYADYYEGKQKLNFATEKFRNAFGSLFAKFATNVCPIIIDSAADRLQVTGFDAGDNDVSAALWDLWTQQRMDRKAGTVHQHAFKMGDAYAIVWPDATGTPVISPNPAYQICCYYSEDGETVEWATKIWQISGGQYRLNLYYPDRTEKYITVNAIKGGPPSSPSAFKMATMPDEPWPVPNPFGRVPVFHFANNCEMGVWGKSELADIIPIQDALNKAVCDMLVAMEFVAFPQRWATGLEVDLDPVTKKPIIPFEAGIDRVWATGDPETRFGQFDQASLRDFIHVQDSFRLDVARISRTPLHYLSVSSGADSSFTSSMYPSGEALKTAEAPFISKIRDRQIDWGDKWEDLIVFAAQIAGFGAELTTSQVEAIWEPAAPKSRKEQAETAEILKRAGIPQEQIWVELDYTEEQIAQLRLMQAADDERLSKLAVIASNGRPGGAAVQSNRG